MKPMLPTLLVTNDFPPRIGGIQSYVYELARRLPSDRLVVLTSQYPGSAQFDAEQPFPIVRYPTSMLLPTPGVAQRAADLVREHQLGAVWYGAAAPLALLTRHLRRAGAQRVVASTHGHEVGWSMLPGTRQLLRQVGRSVDVVTFVSRYSRSRISAALGPTAVLEPLSPGVDADRFAPDADARVRLRTRYNLGSSPTVVCISRLVRRKGQDVLIKAWPAVRAAVPDAQLVVVGDGPYRGSLLRTANASPARDAITFTGSVPSDEIPQHYQLGDVFAMPCRTRGGGLDVEGLGIVFLEASAAGLPVIAGDSGGAPETVQDSITGQVVPGRAVAAVAQTMIGLLRDRDDAAEMGRAGRQWVRQEWTWDASAERLASFLSAPGGAPAAGEQGG